jgi:hypothetical protein
MVVAFLLAVLESIFDINEIYVKDNEHNMDKMNNEAEDMMSLSKLIHFEIDKRLDSFSVEHDNFFRSFDNSHPLDVIVEKLFVVQTKLIFLTIDVSTDERQQVD